MKNTTAPACLSYTETKNLYRQLIENVLRTYDVKSVVAENVTGPKFFDKVEVVENGIKIYECGLSEPSDNFYFDYTCDFANCLATLEDEIYMQRRNGKSQHGYTVTFND